MPYEILESDFKLVVKDTDEHFTVQLLTKYKDVKYQYGNVKIFINNEDMIDEHAEIKFNWRLIEGDESLRDDPEFNDYIASILQFILEDSLENSTAKIGNKHGKDNDSNNDLEEPTY